MKKIVTPSKEVHPYPEAEKTVKTSWDSDAIVSLQSLERYTILKAIEEGKQLVKRVMEEAIKNADSNNVTKFHVQNAISFVLEDMETTRQQERNKSNGV